MDYCAEDGHWVIDVVNEPEEPEPTLAEVAPEPKWRPTEPR